MEFDRHKIWRLVGSNYRTLSEAAPDGYSPVVEVFLLGRTAPVRLGQVQTVRDPAFPWTLLISATEDAEHQSPDEELVFVPEQLVQRVEIRLERSARALGFTHRELEEPSSDE